MSYIAEYWTGVSEGRSWANRLLDIAEVVETSARLLLVSLDLAFGYNLCSPSPGGWGGCPTNERVVGRLRTILI